MFELVTARLASSAPCPCPRSAPAPHPADRPRTMPPTFSGALPSSWTMARVILSTMVWMPSSFASAKGSTPPAVQSGPGANFADGPPAPRGRDTCPPDAAPPSALARAFSAAALGVRPHAAELASPSRWRPPALRRRLMSSTKFDEPSTVYELCRNRSARRRREQAERVRQGCDECRPNQCPPLHKTYNLGGLK